MLRLAGLILLATGWGLAAASLYLVRTPGGIALVTKDSLSFKDTYADTRQWNLEEVKGHRELVGRLIDSGRVKLLAHVIEGKDGEKLKAQLLAATGQSADPANKTARSRASDKPKGSGLLDLVWAN